MYDRHPEALGRRPSLEGRRPICVHIGANHPSRLTRCARSHLRMTVIGWWRVAKVVRRRTPMSDIHISKGGHHLAICAVLGALLISAPAHAAGVEDFYRGRTVSIVIGFSNGSGYDLYARLLARHIGKHIPGHPSVIAQNMPGAGSLKAAQYVFSVAPKDGSVIGTMSRSLPVEPLLGDLQLDARRFTWLGNITNN